MSKKIVKQPRSIIDIGCGFVLKRMFTIIKEQYDDSPDAASMRYR